LLISPELQGDGDDVAPRLPLPKCCDGGVDSSAERDQDSLTVRRPMDKLLDRSGQPGERAMKRVSRQYRGVAMGGGKPAKLGVDLVGPDSCGFQHGGSLHKLRNRRGRGGTCGATLAVERDTRDQPVIGEQRDPDEISARSTAGGAGEAAGGRGPAASIVGEIRLEEVPVHRLKIKWLQPAVCRPGLVTRVA
jgi:hypothetical protein